MSLLCLFLGDLDEGSQTEDDRPADTALFVEVVAHYPELLGIGIDENTAIVGHDDQFEVMGAGKVVIFDGKTQSKKKVLTLSPGQKFDLKRRTAT